MLDFVQLHPMDALARNALVRVINQHHSGRIKQENLDFYRHEYVKYLSFKKNGGEIIFIAALKNCSPIGVSCCSISRKTGNASRSITVVDKRFRKNGLGRALLAAKVSILKWQYPSSPLTTFAAKTNPASVKICEAINLHLLSEVTKLSEDGKDLGFLRFSTVKDHDINIERSEGE